MKRRNFIKAAGLMATVPAIESIASVQSSLAKEKEIYEWRIYTLTGNGAELDAFYKDSLIPAYNSFRIKVGAFTLYKKENEEKRFYMFIYPNISTYKMVKKELWKNETFRKAAQPFYDSSAVNPVYKEFETFLCEAFDKIPQLLTPDRDRTLFEFRNYKSPNEEANQRKVRMFNVDEIAIFDKVGINSVCYGEVLAGPRMPSLIYLTWYKDIDTRNLAWKKFVEHPDWLRIKGLPEYANTATDNKNILLSPLYYSQI